jgi:hypothetical protein
MINESKTNFASCVCLVFIVFSFLAFGTKPFFPVICLGALYEDYIEMIIFFKIFEWEF